MRTYTEWMDEYALSHQNPINILIHKICVPLIMLSVIGLLWCIPSPAIFLRVQGLNWATLFVSGALCFYFLLNRLMFVGMMIQSVVMLTVTSWMASRGILLWVSLVIFVVSWLFQFWGHKIEGKKPSFADDLAFLLIGPLWVQRALLKRMGFST